MIDVQIVAGKRHNVLAEALYRVLAEGGELISKVFVANNTDKPININHEKVKVVDNEKPLTFEQNHNKLSKLGKSPYILFVDDDAFIFEGAIKTVFEKIKDDPTLAAVGGVNNQTLPTTYAGQPVPTLGSLANFKSNEEMYARISRDVATRYKGEWNTRIFCPGNFLLVPRSIWQDQYGGWDENYENWNEEVDYILWGYLNGYKTLVTPSVYFYHCQATSRTANQLLDNMVRSADYFRNKWHKASIMQLKAKMRKIDPDLVKQLDSIIQSNETTADREAVKGTHYWQIMAGVLTP